MLKQKLKLLWWKYTGRKEYLEAQVKPRYKFPLGQEYMEFCIVRRERPFEFTFSAGLREDFIRVEMNERYRSQVRRLGDFLAGCYARYDAPGWSVVIELKIGLASITLTNEFPEDFGEEIHISPVGHLRINYDSILRDLHAA